jgi:O-methyltransferase/methyltransferase family protein
MAMADDSEPLDQEAARRTLGRMIGGFHSTAILYAAARLGLADRLGDGPKSSEELAPLMGADAPTLRRLMRALVELGVLSEAEEGRFGLTAMGALLREDAPGSLRSVAVIYGDTFGQAWRSLVHSVRTGETAFEHVFGAPFFDYFAGHPEESEAFNQTMASLSATIAADVVARYDFSSVRKVVDVGGGHGALVAAILKANPRASGVLFDLPAVLAGARDRITAAGLGERCELVGGDFFAAVPAGGDAYLLKWILHDWDDERALRILRNCRQAMTQEARLLVVEVVLPDRTPSRPAGAVNDINMMVLTGGRERTESEYRGMFGAAGFQLNRVLPTGAHGVFGTQMSVIEGVAGDGSDDA